MVNRLSVIGLVLALLPLPGHADTGAAPDMVRVQVWPEVLPDRVVYHYRVANRQANSAISGVTVGYDYRQQELLLTTALPAGSRICSPDGWRGVAIADDATGRYNIVWGSAHADYDIRAGDDLTGYAVAVPVANRNLVSTFYTVEFSPGKIGFASAPIHSGDAHSETLANCIDPHTGKSSDTVNEPPAKKPAGGKEAGGCED